METTEATAASRGVLTYIRSRGRNLKEPQPLAPTCSRNPPQENRLGNASHAAPSEAPARVANDAKFPTHQLSFDQVEAKDAEKGTGSHERILKATPNKCCLEVSPKQSAVKIEPVTPEKGLPKRAWRNGNETTDQIGKACEQKCLLRTYARKRKTRRTSNYEDANLTVADDEGSIKNPQASGQSSAIFGKQKEREAESQRLCARVHSFVTCMHVIQGDKCLSQWKGSVMDSVIGAFLTQNVFDTSSSFAFMSLAAKFPLKENDTEYITERIQQNRNKLISHGVEPKMGMNDGMSGDIMVNGNTWNAEEKKSLVVDWDKLREEAYLNGYKLKRTDENRDSVDWEAVRCTDANEISEAIKERGQNKILARRIKDFLNRIVRDHGYLDLEWLRYVGPDKAKEFLLSIRGLGQKSVECVRLLALNQLAFPVDTNVARISVRLGWVPICPLPDGIQLHTLRRFPKPKRIQEYLWTHLCNLDQQTLYELHYQMITFGKVFCTKRKPNCCVCPMKEECKYFESASEGNALPGASRKGSNSSTVCAIEENHYEIINLPPVQNEDSNSGTVAIHYEAKIEDFLVTEPEFARPFQIDIEDNFLEGLYEHYVYELPDLHPLLKALDPREPGDPCPYLLNVTLPETTEPTETCCKIKENCKQCGSNHEEQGPIVKGTFLIPCRTAMRGRFPLNGTYFQVNEVFADDETSYSPIDVPWKWICNLPKRILHMGSSTMALSKEKSVENIIACFNKGFICTRGFDRRTRYPKRICERLLSRGRETCIKNPRRRSKTSKKK